jgi:hypothetical protein
MSTHIAIRDPMAAIIVDGFLEFLTKSSTELFHAASKGPKNVGNETIPPLARMYCCPAAANQQPAPTFAVESQESGASRLL